MIGACWTICPQLDRQEGRLRILTFASLRFLAAWAAYNIGILYWRPTAAAKAMALEWQTTLVADNSTWDQNKFNELMTRKKGPIPGSDNGLFYAYNGELKLGILPVSIFCSGHTYFVQV